MKALRFTGLLVLCMAVATSGFAQKNRQGARKGLGPQIDTSQTVVIEGTVVSFVAGNGQGLPELQVAVAGGETQSFILGPFYYLDEQGFSAAAGDTVRITGYPCATCEMGFVVLEVVNVTGGITLTLRDGNAKPLWVVRQRRPGPEQGGGEGVHQHDMLVPDLNRTQTFQGAVVSFEAAMQSGPGSLVLTTDEGEVSFVLSPAGVVLRAQFEPAVGDVLAVTAAPAATDDGEVWLTLVIKDVASGLELVLRDPSTGLPLGGRFQHSRP